MNKKKVISIVVGAIALLVALFFGVNINSKDGSNQFVGADGQAFTTNNLLGMLDANQNYTVYVTKSGKKYHTDSCRYVLGKQIAINRAEAIEEGYTPCKRCKPDGNNAFIPQQPQTQQKQPESTTGTKSGEKAEPVMDDYLE